MKYVAYYGAWGTSILCLMIVLILLVNNICNIHTMYDPIEGILRVIEIPLFLFIAVFSAWIVCDMKKRMKDL